MSQHLAATLARASDAAGGWGASEVSLEHVLLALCDDPDAEAVLTASRVDVPRLKSETVGYLNSQPRQNAGGTLGVAPALSRILEAAAAAARGGRRRDINGAIVLAAIVGDGKSVAAQILQVQGLTFDEAIRALQAALAPPPREALPDIRPTDDVLARARERVQSRAAPSLRELMNDMPRPVTPPPPPPPSPSVAVEQTPEKDASPSAPEAAETGAGETVQSEFASVEAEKQEPFIEAREQPVFEHREIQPPPPAPFPSAYIPLPSSPPPNAPSTQGGPSQGYVYPDPRVAAPPPAPSFDLGRPVPIATPPPIPPMLPQSAPGFGAPPSDDFGRSRGAPNYGSSANAVRPPPPPGAHAAQRPGGFPPMSPPMSPYGQNGPYGQTGGATALPQSAPQPGPMAMPSPVAGGAAHPNQRAAKSKTESGQLAENIPRAMRVGITERIEVRIGKAAAKAITEGLEGSGVAWRHEVTITQAMSVRLRAPDGGFFIETVSPETQWIENNLGLGNDDFASWRFQVTPQSRGWAQLQIVVSARTIGNDGMAAETALPDQIVDVKVRTNYKQTLARWTGWTIAAIAGGMLAKFGEGGFDIVNTIIDKLIK